MDSAQDYRQKHQLTGGFVVSFNDRTVGWVGDLLTPESYWPGCVAEDESGAKWIACGGSDEWGAERWASADRPVDG